MSRLNKDWIALFESWGITIDPAATVFQLMPPGRRYEVCFHQDPFTFQYATLTAVQYTTLRLIA